MPELITMPKLGFDMAEGTLVRWVKQVGEQVSKGDILVEVETDKATVEVEAFVSGVLKGTFVEEGTVLAVGAPIGVIAAADEDVDLEALQAQAAGELGGEAEAPLAVEQAAPAPEPAAGAPQAATPGAAAPTAKPGDGFVRISPVASRMAQEHGVDVRLLQGSGPQGRIVKRDVEAFLAAPPPGAVPAPAPAVAPPSVSVEREDVALPLSRLRRAIGRRMTESKTTLPHFYVTAEVDMAEVMGLRRQLNEVLADQGGKLSVNDFIVKAAALALREFPNLNAALEGDQVVHKGHINVGVAVAVEGGLLTVVVQDADLKSLAQISAEVKVMAGRARAGKVHPDDIQASTFTTSNLGMFDVASFVAIINPPEAAILATGSVQQVPVVAEGQIAVGTRMKATISADHRVTDGAEAAQFLQAFTRNLEQPMRLML